MQDNVVNYLSNIRALDYFCNYEKLCCQPAMIICGINSKLPKYGIFEKYFIMA